MIMLNDERLGQLAKFDHIYSFVRQIYDIIFDQQGKFVYKLVMQCGHLGFYSHTLAHKVGGCYRNSSQICPVTNKDLCFR